MRALVATLGTYPASPFAAAAAEVVLTADSRDGGASARCGGAPAAVAASAFGLGPAGAGAACASDGSAPGNHWYGQVFYVGGACPAGGVPADGRALEIGAFAALYAILSTAFGGDGVQSFALPSVQGPGGLTACVATAGAAPRYV